MYHLQNLSLPHSSFKRPRHRRTKRVIVLDLGLPPNNVIVPKVEKEAVAKAEEQTGNQLAVSDSVEVRESDEATETSENQGESSEDGDDEQMKNHHNERGETESREQDKEELERVAATVWNQRPGPTENTTFPIINVGLPRSGEDTLWNFFKNLGLVTQYGCGDMKRPRQGCISLGRCIQTNAAEGNDALKGCSTQLESVDSRQPELQVYTQLDSQRLLSTRRPVKTGLIMPQIKYLKELYQFAPQATWILPLHPSQHWAYTLSRHHTLRKRMWNELYVDKRKKPVPNSHVFVPELLEIAAIDRWQAYFEEHTQRIGDFVKQHPTIRLIELQVRLKRAPVDLMQSLGLPLPLNKKRVEDLWQCMRNECDLWHDSLDVVNHYKVTPRPKIKLPTPIFVVGFPKSGTTSVFNFFSCAGAMSQHYCCCGDVADHSPCYSKVMAECILENKANGRPMLENCGEYDLYAQLDGERIFMLPSGGKNPERKAGHYLPQVSQRTPQCYLKCGVTSCLEGWHFPTCIGETQKFNPVFQPNA